jgi:hypothetical protein
MEQQNLKPIPRPLSFGKLPEKRTDDDAALTRLLFYSALRNQEPSELFFRTYGQEKFEMLASHIRAGIGAGNLRAVNVNPVIAAEAFTSERNMLRCLRMHRIC